MSMADTFPTLRDGPATNPAAPRLSVVAPCYNEADGLLELHRRVTAACAEVCRGEAYEIVLVDDGSTRCDRAVIFADLARAGPALSSGSSCRATIGHQLAVTAGLWVCRGERVLIIDADLQDPPELLGAMMAPNGRGRRRGLRPADRRV